MISIYSVLCFFHFSDNIVRATAEHTSEYLKKLCLVKMLPRFVMRNRLPSHRSVKLLKTIVIYCLKHQKIKCDLPNRLSIMEAWTKKERFLVDQMAGRISILFFYVEVMAIDCNVENDIHYTYFDFAVIILFVHHDTIIPGSYVKHCLHILCLN